MKDIFLEEMCKTAVVSAVAKNYICETPRDDELIAYAVAHWDFVFAVWLDSNVFRAHGISGFDKCTSESEPTTAFYRMNAVLVKDEATALHWQAKHSPGAAQMLASAPKNTLPPWSSAVMQAVHDDPKWKQ